MLNRKRLYIISLLISTLMIGLVAIQAYWVKNTDKLQRVYYERDVYCAVDDIARYMESQVFSFNLYTRSYIQPGEGILVLKKSLKDNKIIDTLPLFNAFPYDDKPDTCFYSTKISYYNTVTLFDATMRFESRPKEKQENVRGVNALLQNISTDNYKTILDDTNSIMQRLRIPAIDSCIKATLAKDKINQSYAYAIKKTGHADFAFISDSTFNDKLQESKYTNLLFADKAFSHPYVLHFYLYDSKTTTTGDLNIALILSAIIIAGLLAAFTYFFSVILRQKKLSEMKTDFINNMTHEFMTPVTNIALALETIEKNKSKQKEPDERLLELIGTENDHLKDNINKVLQVSVLEKGSFLLDLTPINIHELLVRVAKTFSIPVQNKKGAITFDFAATNYKSIADETHILNLFYNIIDNSVKYASERPLSIKISTGNARKKLWVKIEDNGIGMSTDISKNIFTKFYRGSNSNVHDVKGFGLGLSYVKSIAEAHDIEIEMNSEAGKGTSFTFWFKL